MFRARRHRTATAEAEARRLVDAYGNDVLRLAYAYLRSRADAEDVCQDVLVKLVSRDEPFESADHERAWVFRCAANACKDRLRSAARRKGLPLEAAGEVADLAAWEDGRPLGPVPDDAPGPVTAAVLALPVAYREAIHLRYYEGLSVRQAAEAAGIGEDAMAKRLSRARSMLRDKLGGESDDEQD